MMPHHSHAISMQQATCQPGASGEPAQNRWLQLAIAALQGGATGSKAIERANDVSAAYERAIAKGRGPL